MIFPTTLFIYLFILCSLLIQSKQKFVFCFRPTYLYHASFMVLDFALSTALQKYCAVESKYAKIISILLNVLCVQIKFRTINKYFNIVVAIIFIPINMYPLTDASYRMGCRVRATCRFCRFSFISLETGNNKLRIYSFNSRSK